jgi:DNA-directed RNA polymerase specialized sigma subunit
MTLGIVIVLITFTSLRQTSGKTSEPNQPEDAAIASMTEADNTIDEINNTGAQILGELDDKHQELLFLYNMIEDRKKDEIGSVSEIVANDNQTNPSEEPSMESFKNPKLGKIRDLYDQGMTEEEIAKTLGIGQGEVKLILSIGKGR